LGELTYPSGVDRLYEVGGSDSQVDEDGLLTIGPNETASWLSVVPAGPVNYYAAITSLAIFVPHPAPPPLAVSASVSKKCMAGKAYLVVQARNDSDVAAALTIVTDYGVKVFPSVAAGAAAAQMFATKQTSYPSGQVALAASSGARSGQGVFSYGAATC
jgi:hypothetical protein